jgi:hypothetical protein
VIERAGSAHRQLTSTPLGSARLVRSPDVPELLFPVPSPLAEVFWLRSDVFYIIVS